MDPGSVGTLGRQVVVVLHSILDPDSAKKPAVMLGIGEIDAI